MLLRSLAVASHVRGPGIVRQLVTWLKDKVLTRGQLVVWLLRTTAEHVFVRAGYKRVVRNEVPDEVWLCRQFAVLCSSAT